MANDITRNPFVIDTADSATVITGPLPIRKIRWTGATTAGHQAIVQDKENNTFWESVCPGSNYVEESDFTTFEPRPVLNGLIVPTLSSGALYIYF